MLSCSFWLIHMQVVLSCSFLLNSSCSGVNFSGAKSSIEILFLIIYFTRFLKLSMAQLGISSLLYGFDDFVSSNFLNDRISNPYTNPSLSLQEKKYSRVISITGSKVQKSSLLLQIFLSMIPIPYSLISLLILFAL